MATAKIGQRARSTFRGETREGTIIRVGPLAYTIRYEGFLDAEAFYHKNNRLVGAPKDWDEAPTAELL